MELLLPSSLLPQMALAESISQGWLEAESLDGRGPCRPPGLCRCSCHLSGDKMRLNGADDRTAHPHRQAGLGRAAMSLPPWTRRARHLQPFLTQQHDVLSSVLCEG